MEQLVSTYCVSPAGRYLGMSLLSWRMAQGLQRSIATRRRWQPSGSRPAGHGRGQGRVPSQTPSWQTASSHNPVVMSINDRNDPWLDQTSNCWPLEEQHYAEVFAVSASFKTDDPPLWSGLLSPSARAGALRDNRGHCLNCHEDTHPFHPFINASGCLNPEHLRPPATLAVRGRFLTGGMPYINVCVSFNYFTSRFSWLHCQAVQRCGRGF